MANYYVRFSINDVAVLTKASAQPRVLRSQLNGLLSAAEQKRRHLASVRCISRLPKRTRNFEKSGNVTLPLLSETRRIVDQVERITDRPVRFIDDPVLPVMASLRIARNGATEHVMTIRPGGESLDYVVVYQCGYVLRLYQTPPDQRVDFAANPSDAADRMVPMLQALVPPGESAPEIRAVAERMSHWLLLTLRSLPTGLRIDRWIRTEFPALHTQQEVALTRQQEENAAHIAWRSGKLRFPPQFLALDAAHSLFADRLLGTTYLSTPFEAVGLVDDGKRLLSLLDSASPEPHADRTLVESWGAALGIRAWFDWVPFRS